MTPDPSLIAEQQAAAIRDAWIREADAALVRGSIRLRLLPRGMRNNYRNAFLEAVEYWPEDEAECRRSFADRVELYGNPLLMLFLSIAWQILWHLWTKRRNEA